MACTRCRKRAATAVAAVVVALAPALGCGDAEPTRAASAPAAEAPSARTGAASNAPPVIESLRIEPGDPLPGQRVRAVMRTRDAEGDRVKVHTVWLVDGEVVARDQDSVELLGTRKGDRVVLEAWASDAGGRGETRRAQTRVANRPPELWGVAIETPEEVGPDQTLVASPQGQDADGDPLEFRYEWRVNGERAEAEGAGFSTADLVRGDEVQVAVVASDGTAWSEERTSDVVTLGNTPPRIVSDAQWIEENGEFRYQVEARDPDGDRTLRYRIAKGPAGMEVDPLLGEVTWRPTEADAGTHDVEIEVDDLHGGRSVQSIQLTIRVEEEDQGGETASTPGPAAYGGTP